MNVDELLVILKNELERKKNSSTQALFSGRDKFSVNLENVSIKLAGNTSMVDGRDDVNFDMKKGTIKQTENQTVTNLTELIKLIELLKTTKNNESIKNRIIQIIPKFSKLTNYEWLVERINDVCEIDFKPN